MISYFVRLFKNITQRGEGAEMQRKDCNAKKDKGVESKVAELRQQRKGVTWGKGMNTRKAIEEGRRNQC